MGLLKNMSEEKEKELRKQLREQKWEDLQPLYRMWDMYITDQLKEDIHYLDTRNWNWTAPDKIDFKICAYKFMFPGIRDAYMNNKNLISVKEKLKTVENDVVNRLIENGPEYFEGLKVADWNDQAAKLQNADLESQMIMAAMFKYHFPEIFYLRTGDMRFQRFLSQQYGFDTKPVNELKKQQKRKWKK